MDSLTQFFSYEHLPPHLQEVSKPFSILAEELMKLPSNPERTTARRKLLEAKDCAVRALLYQAPPAPVMMQGVDMSHGIPHITP